MTLVRCLTSGALALFLLTLKVAAADSEAAVRALVFSKTLGFRHASITNGVEALRELGREHEFIVDATENPDVFTPTNLARYKVIVFLSVTGNVLDSEQKAALKGYVLGGGGFVAIHGAIFGPKACEDQWDWYGEMLCCAFTNHSRVVPAMVNIEDHTNSSTAGLPTHWQRTDEWYNFTSNPRGRSHVLATVDESTYHGGGMGSDHPIAWCQSVGKGRMWYTAMGHTESSFSEPRFRQHLLGGIQYAAGIE